MLQRREGLSSRDAIYKACLLRFRPIMMTTTGAILGALPLAIGLGEGSELRQPLGISIVGGLFLSQILTLYTTPVVFLYMDRFGGLDQRVLEPLVPRHHEGQAGRSRAVSRRRLSESCGLPRKLAAFDPRSNRADAPSLSEARSRNAVRNYRFGRSSVRAALPSLILALRLWRYRLRVVA